MLLHSIKLRKAVGCQKLVGPAISQAKNINFCTNSTTIALKVPRHKTSIPAENRTANREIELQYNLFRNLISDKPGWIAYAPLLRHWDFYGPMFAGVLGDVSLNLALISPEKVDKSISFFHPRAFEYILGDYLSYRFAERKTQGSQDWNGPYNWAPTNKTSATAVTFSVVRSNGYRGKRYRYLISPISDHLLLSIEVRLSANSYTLEGKKSSTHDMSNMDQLIDDIFASVDITLSPEAEQQRMKALEGLEDTSLVADYPPLKWGSTELKEY